MIYLQMCHKLLNEKNNRQCSLRLVQSDNDPTLESSCENLIAAEFTNIAIFLEDNSLCSQ